MNTKLIIDLTNQSTVMARDVDPAHEMPVYQIKLNLILSELLVMEFIKVIEDEITLVKGYKEQSFNDRDREWHEGKVQHLTKLIDKTKDHFGVGNVGS